MTQHILVLTTDGGLGLGLGIGFRVEKPSWKILSFWSDSTQHQILFFNPDDLFRAVRASLLHPDVPPLHSADIITWKFYVLPGNLRHIQQAEPSLLVVPSHDFGLQLVRKGKDSPFGPLVAEHWLESLLQKPW